MTGQLQRLPLRRKLLLGLGLLCVANLVVAVFAFWSLSALAALTTGQLGTAARLARVAGQIAEFTLQCRRFEKDIFLNLGDAAEFSRYQKEWRNADADLARAVADYSNLAQSPEDQAVAGQWAQLQKEYRQAMAQVLQAVEAGKIQTADQANQLITPYKDSIRKLTQLATDTAHAKAAKVAQVEADVEQVQVFFKTLILVVTAVALLGCIWWSYRLSIEVARPLQELSQAADQVAAGNWHVQLPIESEDEMGRLAQALNRLAGLLREKATP